MVPTKELGSKMESNDVAIGRHGQKISFGRPLAPMDLQAPSALVDSSGWYLWQLTVARAPPPPPPGGGLRILGPIDRAGHVRKREGL